MTRSRRFAQVDVFTDTPYLGNPVAVVLDGDGLDDSTMQRFAAWTNLSETTFVVSPTVAGADYRLRIFTITEELPFAGHPTLGSAHAWLDHGGRPAGGTLVQQCGLGLVELRVSGPTISFRAPDRLRTGPLDEELVARIARGLRVDRRDIVDHEWLDNGPRWAGVLLRDADAVLAVEPDAVELDGLKVGVVGAYPAGAPHAFEVRAFYSTVGVNEDPVTGSLNAAVGQWLTTAGVAPPRYTASQGARVGRAGVVTVDDRADGLWVGGISHTLVRGVVEL
ncbi:PhzF family phenazine biosynthesis protein [Nakamurella deserti]|uniref:PhzF family phenazine biosynthesis protein n=1 Tax=Nakamurella deserti TaxID=2164074 RepID=UPI000DBE65C4|nr:PhzF family phenazine biosynthesis protein [Nakamurella deserti]